MGPNWQATLYNTPTDQYSGMRTYNMFETVGRMKPNLRNNNMNG